MPLTVEVEPGVGLSVSAALEPVAILVLMKVGRVILAFALFGALVGGGFVAVWWAIHPGVDSQEAWLTPGDFIVMFGLLGLVLGAAIGLVAWALSSWVERRYYH